MPDTSKEEEIKLNWKAILARKLAEFKVSLKVIISILETTENLFDYEKKEALTEQKMKFKEMVICSAVIFEGQIIRGHRHANCLQTAKMMGLNTSHISSDEGFITSKNRFVGRKEAFEIQKSAGIKSILEGGIHDGDEYRNGECYSEDLY